MIEQYIKETNLQQYSREEISIIIDLVNKIKPCNMLVFGIGYDTKIWQSLNTGITLFLEHDEKYIKKFTGETPGLEIIQVDYTCNAHNWKHYLNKDLTLNLPEKVLRKKWDIVLVDAPVGNINGRMESIYTASKLNFKHCFVHDCDRIIEKTYCDKYLGINYKLTRKLRWYVNTHRFN